MYAFIKLIYQRRQITPEQVWAYADAGKITANEALLICGPRKDLL